MNSNQSPPVSTPRPAGYAIGDLLIEPHLRRIRRPEGDIELTQRVFDLLQAFIDEPFVLHTREALFQRVWGTLHIEDTNLTQNISILRKAFGDERKHWIRTVSRTGYSFEPPHEIQVVQDARDLAPRPLGQASGAPTAQDPGTDEAPGAPTPAAPASSAALRPSASPLRIAAAVLIGLASLLVQSASPKILSADATHATPGLSIGIVVTQTDLARNDTERAATRLLREWVRWKLSRLPAIILIEEQDLISGRPIPGFYLDLNVVVSPDAPTQHVFDYAFRPIYNVVSADDGTDEGPGEQYVRRLVLDGNAERLPAVIDRASREILGHILPHRRKDLWPALAMDTEAAHRFAAAAVATRNQDPGALPMLEAAVQAAPEFGPARLLLASELAERRHFRQASEQAQLAQSYTAPMPSDAATLMDAETSALIPTRRAHSKELYRQFWLANPTRMEFLFNQARIEQSSISPEATYELLSRDEWERETGPMRVRRLIARADAAFLLGYLDQGDNSVTEAINRIDIGQGSSTAELGDAQFIAARIWSQRYAQDDPGEPFDKAAKTLDSAGHEYQAHIARLHAAVMRNDLAVAEERVTQVLRLAQAYGDPMHEVWSLRMMHMIYLWNGRRDKARQALETGLRAASQAGALPLRDLMEQDLLDLAIEDLRMREAMQRMERLRNHLLWTKYRYRNARYASELLRLRGRYRDALAVLDASLGDSSRASRWDMPKDELGGISCSRMMALLHAGTGSMVASQARGCSDPALVELTAAHVALIERRKEDARRHLESARKEVDSTPDSNGDVIDNAWLATLLIRLGDLDAARSTLEVARAAKVESPEVMSRVEIDVAQAELSAAEGDWPAVTRQVAALRAEIPAEALQYLNRLALLEIARLQAQGEGEEARKRASELDEAARRNADAVTRAELQRISGGIFGTTLGLNK